jgi:excisionase family DNA binding protein
MAQPIAANALADLEQRITLTVEEVAPLLGLGRTAAYEAARRGQIPSRRLGRRVLIPVPALLEWLGAEDDSAIRR